jgi:enoyl-CoA hydratase/carnithine racemase
MGKHFCYQMNDMAFHQRFALHREVMARLCTTEDSREGIEAFIEKRKPIWKGK